MRGSRVRVGGGAVHFLRALCVDFFAVGVGFGFVDGPQVSSLGLRAGATTQFLSVPGTGMCLTVCFTCFEVVIWCVADIKLSFRVCSTLWICRHRGLYFLCLASLWARNLLGDRKIGPGEPASMHDELECVRMLVLGVPNVNFGWLVRGCLVSF